jgi:Antibiotic biosynthesis monooxygenase.
MLYIFEVRIREGHSAEEYAEAWVRASRLIQQAPGALGTRLHRKIGDDRTLIAIAHWTSKAARDAAEARHDPRVAEIIRSVAHCCEIRALGEFDEPEWVVEPALSSTHADWGHIDSAGPPPPDRQQPRL